LFKKKFKKGVFKIKFLKIIKLIKNIFLFKLKNC
jgi:hypothetical protein